MQEPLGIHGVMYYEVSNHKEGFDTKMRRRRSSGEAHPSRLGASWARAWGGFVKGICPRGNNKVVIIVFLVYDKCLFYML